MDYKEYAVETPIGDVHPYEKNPRNNKDSVSKVAASIKAFGFLQPIVCDGNGVILAGHTRYAAAKELGLTKVPVLYARGLTPEQAKAYRIADNKVAESSQWDEKLLLGELADLAVEAPDFNPTDFGFEPYKENRSRLAWHSIGKKCDLKNRPAVRTKNGYIYTSFMTTSPEGTEIEEIKQDETMIQPFTDILIEYLESAFGRNLSSADWCICTTPRRRHKEGFHFSTEVCKRASAELGIVFYQDAAKAKTRGRVNPKFELITDPKEKNVILYDDILTTGITIGTMRDMLLEKGHVVFPVIAIRNM